MVKKGLTIWSTKKLFLAGRIMIANQVILAMTWYLCSYACIANSAFNQTKAAICNYIWGVNMGNRTRAKVAWSIIIQTVAAGRVKIIDHTLQALALLTKLIIWAIQPGYAPWKTFARHRTGLSKQTSSGKWPYNNHWLMQARRPHKGASTLWEAVHKSFSRIYLDT